MLCAQCKIPSAVVVPGDVLRRCQACIDNPVRGMGCLTPSCFALVLPGYLYCALHAPPAQHAIPQRTIASRSSLATTMKRASELSPSVLPFSILPPPSLVEINPKSLGGTSLCVVFKCPNCDKLTSPGWRYCDTHAPSWQVEQQTAWLTMVAAAEAEVLDDAPGTKRCLYCTARYPDTEELLFCIMHRNPAARASIVIHCPGVDPTCGCTHRQNVDIFNRLCESCSRQKFLMQYPGYEIGSASGAGNNCLIDALLQVVNSRFRAQSTEQRKEQCNFIRAQLISVGLVQGDEYLGTDNQVRAILQSITISPDIYKVTTFHIGVNNKLLAWVNFQGKAYGRLMSEDLYLWNYESILVDPAGQIYITKHFSPIFKKPV